MMKFLLILICALPFTLEESIVVHEKRDRAFHDAADRQRIDGDTFLPMRIGLQPNKDAISKAESWLMEVSDPDSTKFGQHWTQKEVIQAFWPTEETIRVVTEWLSSYGIKEFAHSDNGMWFAFDLEANRTEKMLHAEYFEERHQTPRSEWFEVSCDQYSLPEALGEHIDYITPGVKPIHIIGGTERSREHMRKSKHQPLRYIHEEARNAPSQSLSASLPPHPSFKPLQPGPPLNWTNYRPPFPPDELLGCSRAVSPACLRILYNFSIADPNLPVSKTNSMGIFEDFSITLQSDLNSFFEYYTTNVPIGTTPIFHSIDGAITRPKQIIGWRRKFFQPHKLGKFYVEGESTLDLQMAYPIVYPQTITVFEVNDPYWAAQSWLRAHEGLFNTFLDAIDGSYCRYSALSSLPINTSYGETGDNPKYDPIYPDRRPHGYKGKLQCGVFKPTNVISISYGKPEHLQPSSYNRRQCLEFLKLGLQGVTIFESSGDSGVGPCTGRNRTLGDRVFGPNAAAACPWITSVGGTHIPRNHSVYTLQEAVSFSGGGFSTIHKRPAYQDNAILQYFKDYDPDIPYFYDNRYRNSTGRYNRNGRGFPDLAATARNAAGVLEGAYSGGYGTSAAAPIVASLFNRIIEERIRTGKGPLGFINPTLYKNPAALNDIWKGNNGYFCTQGFNCVPGWDPVTGLGTPNYGKLLDVFLNLP